MTQTEKKRSLNGYRLFRRFWDVITMPAALVLLTHSHRVDPGYAMPWHRRIRMGFRFWRNSLRIQAGTSWRAHLVMAMKLLETSQSTQGDVVECGCWKGGATVNLSLAAALTGRRLLVYDSFEGLPPPTPGDPVAQASFRDGYVAGVFAGSLEEVSDNVRRLGAIEVCSFHKGWFQDTLPGHESAIVLAFLDVDYYASLHDCLINLWDHLVDGACLFMDEYRNMPYCSVFFSEKYWSRYFDCDPPGLVGIGSGLQMGMFFNDPAVGMGHRALQFAESTAYCRKGDRAVWEYYPETPKAPDDPDDVQSSPGGES